jgi:glutaredoxin 3
VHGLTPGPDGRCVLCHRDGTGAPATSWRPLVGLVVVVVAIGAGAVAWKGTRAPHDKPPESVAFVVPQPSLAAPVATGEQVEPAAADDEKEQRGVVLEQKRKHTSEAETKNVRIVMYTTRPCDLCDTARAWLKQQELAYRDVDVGSDASALADMHKLTPSNEVPVFDVDGEVLVGFGPTNVAGAVRRAADKRTK